MSVYLLFAYTLLTTKIELTRMSDLPSQGLSPKDLQTSPLVENDNGEAVVAVANDDASQTVQQNDEENLFSSKKRKSISKVWAESKIVKLPDKSQKAEYIPCKTQLALQKGGTTMQYARHLKGCVRRQIKLSRQKELTLKTTISKSEMVALV